MSLQSVVTGGIRCQTFFHDGIAFDVWGQVFSPAHYAGPRHFTEWLAALNELAGKTMIEIGGGCGFTGQYLLLKHGMGHLAQGDINPYAVSCARENSRQLGIADRVTVAHSDVFDGIKSDTRADVIYWNHPWNYISPCATFNMPIKHSFFDPGYGGLRKYLGEAPRHLAPDGRLFLGFNSRGHRLTMKKLAKELGYEAVIRKQQQSAPGADNNILYELLRPSCAMAVGFGCYAF